MLFCCRIAISPDCSLIVSASHDQTLKSWHTTPRHPDAPQPPRVIKITDTTVLISWTAPPCFNCDVTAFHYQYRVGLRGEWTPPEVGQSIPPHLRNRVIDGLIPATHYQFRMQAENLMGKSDWSLPCPLVSKYILLLTLNSNNFFYCRIEQNLVYQSNPLNQSFVVLEKLHFCWDGLHRIQRLMVRQVHCLKYNVVGMGKTLRIMF